ncbi:MAG: biotin--[acetyl-CoA-carboxylase] ligase [Muribaculaceae bacterium]|nr:biotin--[acetyl-CoA-carboxylase] ligase [Muribaculaceae bacterium]
MEILTLSETESTNTYCKAHSGSLVAPVAVRTLAQTAGRGQRGNSWEAAPGKNLTFSIVWRPVGVAPNEQFSISEATALGVVDYLKNRGIEAKVKWPNDIYVDNRKICGILIEHSVAGTEILRSVIGVGINVNQEDFLSDAPNPVSMRNLTGLQYDLEKEMEQVCSQIERHLAEVATPDGRERMHRAFMSNFWRYDGVDHPFREPASGRCYEGMIRDVDPAGFLKLEDISTGEIKEYAFKEVEFIL